ncbi:MAG: bifunctional diaminohydroxyphosphoribosylaminopyrimidine deaminase/5-amino-6-(5-phosphoribosylamino)uracil reductase RibD [Pyrinomonadaceae bacterium]
MGYLNSLMQQTIESVKSPANESTALDRVHMTRALALASQGVGEVSPGPLVGCVIVSTDGKVVGEGTYLYEKLKHAETYALEQAGANARGGTAYVSLEPHAHYGRTPPCTDALIKAGIGRVVVPIEDPNPKVSGKGFEHLRSAGVEVCTGLMAREAEILNEKYVHFMRTARPYVHLKLATSLDGKIATRTGDSRWISGSESRRRVHELRHEYDAILIGAGTALADDPLLTDRSGKPRRRPLVRVVLDQKLKISAESKLALTARDAPVLIFADEATRGSVSGSLEARGVEVVHQASDRRELRSTLEELGLRSIQSVLVEGGSSLAGKLLDAGLVNKASFFIAPIIIGGREAPTAIGATGAETLADALKLQDIQINQWGNDIEVTGYPHRKGEGNEG